MSCQKRLQWIVQVGAKRGLKKPNIEEVQQAKVIPELLCHSALNVTLFYGHLAVSLNRRL
jgi:fructosamine-3-kinase